MIATFLTNVKVRYEPSTSSDYAYIKKAGSTVKVDGVVQNEGRYWISFYEQENEFFCCALDTDGEKYISFGKNDCVSLNQNNSGHSAVKKEGCCFLCACYLAGLNTIEEADECWDWATEKGKVRKSDSYVLINKDDLVDDISNRYGTSKRDGYFVKGNGHFYVAYQGKEVFNSIRPGYGH